MEFETKLVQQHISPDSKPAQIGDFEGESTKFAKCSLMPIRRFPILCGLATDPVRPHCDPQSHALGKGSRRESRVVSLACKSFSCMSLESDHGRSKAKTLQLSIRHASFTRQGQGEEHESLPSVWHEHSVSCRVPDLRLLHGSHCESTEG